MSETSKMGLFGSKEKNTSTNTGQLNKDESPERYAPYSVDSDSETYDTEALSIMDINDIIGVQTEPVGDSTLESEIAALSEIITDANVPEIVPDNFANKDTNKITATANVDSSQKTEEKKDSSDQSATDELITDPQLITTESSIKMSLDVTTGEKESTESRISIDTLELSKSKEIKDADQSTCSKDVTAISKSLQLIGEAYDSDDSQESDLDEMQIGKEPKVIFSCKPLVEKQSHKVTVEESCEAVENVTIDESAIDDSTSVIKDAIVIDTLEEQEKLDENNESPVKELVEEISVNNDCENVTDKSNDEPQDELMETVNEISEKIVEEISEKNTDEISEKIVEEISGKNVVNEISNENVNELPKETVNEILEDNNILLRDDNDLIEEQKLSVEPVNDCVEINSTSIITDPVSTSDNENHESEEKNNTMIVECELENKPTSQEEIINMEVEVIEKESEDNNEACVITQSTRELQPQAEISEITLSEDVNKIIQNESLKSEEISAISVVEITQTSVVESEVKSESTGAIVVVEKSEIIEDNLIEMDEEEIKIENSTKEIVEEICKPSIDGPSTCPTLTIDEVTETIASEECVKESQDISTDNEEVEKKEINISSDEKSESPVENVIANENCPETIEESVLTADLEAVEEKSIIEQEKNPEFLAENKKLSECTDSPSEFVDALSPTEFATEVIDEQTLQIYVSEKIDEKNDNEEISVNKINTNDDVISEKCTSDLEIPHDQPLDEKSEEVPIEATSDTEPIKLENESIVNEDKIPMVIGKSVAVISDVEISQSETQDPPIESLSTNSSDRPPTPELDKQIIPELPLADTELKATDVESDTTKPVELADIDINIEKISESHAEEPENLTENHLPDIPESVEHISSIIDNVPDLKSILDDQKIQIEESDITEPVEFSEDIASTANKVIDDIKQNFLSPSDEFLEQALKNPISTHTDDSLDDILNLDLIPNIDDTEIKSNDSLVVSTVENIPEEMDTIEKEPNLDILLADPEISAVNQADDFLSDVIETLNESASRGINVDSKIEIDSSVAEVRSIDKDVDLELEKEPIQDILQANIDDVVPPEVDMPFSLTQEEKLEIPDDILADPLAVVDSGIEILQANTEITELESAVKFLQESEDHEIESPPVLSPKMIENIANEINQREDSSTIYLSNQEICDDSLDLVAELDSTSESIAVSEAEIINEAAKLESEKKLNEEANDSSMKLLNIAEVDKTSDNNESPSESEIVKKTIKAIGINIDDVAIRSTQNIFPVKSTMIPKTSILEERLKEPPKIEIPIVDPPRLCDMPTTPKTSLLIPRDSRISNYQKMMESPKSSRDEIKMADTSRRDTEKHDIENVGSPRIILKIAKSALTDCAEPRSPKSPKIRSAANSPNPDDSPGQKLGKIKLKLSKGGHPSIIPNDNIEESALQWHTEGSSSLSPLGMKIKLSKSGDASIVQHEIKDTPKHMCADSPRRTESPLGMKIKLSKTGDASIIQPDKSEDEINKETKIKEKTESCHDTPKRTDSPLGMKIKLLTTGDASIVSPDYEECKELKIKEKNEAHQDNQKRTDSHMAMKIKLSKKGGASIVSANDNKEKMEIPNSPRRTESPLGMTIKLSKTGDASIIHKELLDDQISSGSHESTVVQDIESMPGTPKRPESSIGMKIKLSKDGDASIVHSEKPPEEEQQELKRIDSPIGMKIKLSKSGDASIIQSQTSDTHDERSELKGHKFSDTATIESMKIRLSKTGHGTIVANESDTAQRSKEFIEAHHIFSQKREQLVNRSEVTIEPIQLSKRSEVPAEISPKRKDTVTLSPIETKKAKIDGKLPQLLPEVTIQPVASRDQTPTNFDQPNSSAISRQQMNVINQEISITHLRPFKSTELTVSEKLRKILTKPPANSAEECEIIEHHPELIIVNENSNSSQDIMIIDEVPALRVPETKTPKKRGRPRRNPIAMQFTQPKLQIPPDPLASDDIPSQLMNNLVEPKENERPRRTCRNQKSYAPPKRGRGRGRGKRKFDKIESSIGKRARLDRNYTSMEEHSTTLITLSDEATDEVPNNSSELYKALRQPLKGARMDILTQNPVACTVTLKNRVDALLEPRLMARLEGRDSETSSLKTNPVQLISGHLKKDSKDTSDASDHQNWLTPSSKKYIEVNRNDGISTIQVIDEETRMSAESLSRSQTPARNMSANAAETIINEESQGSVLSTATTESEKVKVKNRRMEISFDPDEGPFTVDKIAEYEWPIERKGETFMIQEQISQYLGVKSFKRKYPDLKRRMVDMEERNFLRENGLVSEAMCDMGLTAIHSSEVLDIMCSDFPDQYEEYRKHMREKQIKEHSKKQKELSAAATAEKNRIDLAEMAVQSALSWNVNLNKARRESRRCSLDLQTFTIHVPKKLQKLEKESKVSHYPVALIPGQYTDYYREYTPAELRYYPLNTVLYGPMRPNERKFDSQSEGSPSDTDSDSSSDDSSCSSSEGTQDTEESQSTMDDVDIELSNQKDKSLKCKMCLKNLNKTCKSEVLIQCGTCSGHVHPSCIDLTLDMVPHIQAYAWQCTDCKTCVQCHDPADEDKMLFCDMCDRGYHIYCVGLRRVPQGRWHCQECAICASCGSREAGGVNADRNSVALWQHEYKKGEKNTRVYVSTLCVPCSKLWRKGRYCPHCSRCHTVSRLDTDDNLVHCSACDKYLHLECVESKDLIVDRKNYQCDLCIQNRQRIVKPSVSKVIRA